MSLKDTFKQMRDLLANITSDLEKSENGNKAASQRVRTGTVRLEKIAKLYRKESIFSEKKNKGQKKPARATAGATAKSKMSHNAKNHKSATATASRTKTANPKAKSATIKAKSRSI